MRQITPAWLTAPATGAVLAALQPASPLFVGGCVRDALLSRPTHDVDLCVTSPPEETMRLARAAGIAAHPTGVEHGVVTLVSGGKSFEVATLRRDVATDGRRAVVAFTDDPGEDAARRDFTMNALYARSDGRVLDPLGTGLADLDARRLRFVGLPERRIAEDYLRILRFFRFTAELDIPTLDAEGLAACHAGATGLSRIARERIGAEMRRLAAAPDPGRAFAAMGPALSAILPGAAPLPGLWAAERALALPPRATRRLLALGLPVATIREQLRLSRDEERALNALAAAHASPAPPAEKAWRFGPEAAADAIALSAATGTPPPDGWQKALTKGAAAHFPVTGRDLIANGHPPGPGLGQTLHTLEARWLASDFTLGKAALLQTARV